MPQVSIENCLYEENNRFRLVLAAAKRARQIAEGYEPMVYDDGSKPTVLALAEIEQRKTSIKGILNNQKH